MFKLICLAKEKENERRYIEYVLKFDDMNEVVDYLERFIHRHDEITVELGFYPLFYYTDLGKYEFKIDGYDEYIWHLEF